MSKPAQKIHASTQRFTEIQDIADNIVVFEGASACLVVEIQAINFALLSVKEQEIKLFAYASLLNSLSFPIQILIRNKKVNISSYLKLLDLEIQKLSSSQMDNKPSEKLITFIKKYRDFVSEMVKVNSVLDKKFYIVIPFSHLERGVKGVLKKEDFLNQAKAALHTKAESLLTQLGRLNLRAKTLEKEELIRLFYETYNQEAVEGPIEENIKAPIIKTKA